MAGIAEPKDRFEYTLTEDSAQGDELTSTGRRDGRPRLSLVSTPPEQVTSAEEILNRLVDQWVRIAVRHARVRKIDHMYIADVVRVDGAWADGSSEAKALKRLSGVLHEWVTMKLEDGDDDIPPMEGVHLVVQS